MTNYILSFFLFGLFGSLSAQNTAFISVADAKEDLNFMVKSIEEVHYNPYTKIEKQEFVKRKAALVADWSDRDSIDLKTFAITAMKMTALISKGNITVDWQNDLLFNELGSYGFIPFKVTQNSNGQVIATYTMDNEISKGSQIQTINGKNAKELFNDVLMYTAGTNSFKNAFAENFFPLYLFLNGIKAPYLIEYDAGEIGYIANGLNIVEASLLLTSSLPQKSYSFIVIDNNVAYLEFNGTGDRDSFELFLENSFEEIFEKNIDKLIIDIRNHNGIDSEMNNMLLAYITDEKYRQNSGRYWKVSEQMKSRMTDSVYVEAFGKKFSEKYSKATNGTILKNLVKKKIKNAQPDFPFEGKSCVLINSNTFYAGNQFADAVKTFQLSTLIGKPTGKKVNDFGEIIELVAPLTQTRFYVPTTFEIGADNILERKEVISPNISAKGDELLFAIQWLKK